jgi:hypothetical protein
MRRFVTTVRKDWPRLVLELLVVVLGISASFALEEWRGDRENRRVERRAWAGVAANLATDTLFLSARARQLDGMIAAYDALIAGRPSADSVESYMDLAISYVNFVRTDFAYEELRQSSSARQVRNAALLARMSRMYTAEYSLAAEWEAINRDFVLDRMIPYLEAEAPAPYVTASRATAAIGLSRAHAALAGEPRFRNLLATNRFFKDAQRTVYRLALARARRLHADALAESRRPAGARSDTAPVG